MGMLLRAEFIYTAAIVGLYKYSDIYANTDFNSIIPDQPSAVTRTLGILNILAETSIQTTLWGNKCCLLLLYNRLTLFDNHITLQVMVAAYTGLSYVAIIVALYKGWCRPFSDYLVLVPSNLECLTWKHYNIMQMTLNLSTDLVLLLIPVTLISKLNMKFRMKLLLVCLFSMGIFVMISAILMKVAVFTDSTDPIWFMWSVREVSTAMLVGNLVLGLPILKTWWRLIFPGGGSTRGKSSAVSGSGCTSSGPGSSVI
ncbi:family decarboxylase [Colletotrichum tabaci]|uniref:Family decarboxylase n=1 Tax=Colletotrichum tabaci TaxID=1209068 RepID=A0AAV9TIM8_9PEZI